MVVGSFSFYHCQVLSPTQFISVYFSWKIIDLPGGQINDPWSQKYFSLSLLPATPLSLFWNLEGLFELTRCPSKALNLPRALLPELQRNKDTVRYACCARCRGPRTPSKTANANLDCEFVENAHFFTYLWSLIVKSLQDGIELVNRPGHYYCCYGVSFDPSQIPSKCRRIKL